MKYIIFRLIFNTGAYCGGARYALRNQHYTPYVRAYTIFRTTTFLFLSSHFFSLGYDFHLHIWRVVHFADNNWYYNSRTAQRYCGSSETAIHFCFWTCTGLRIGIIWLFVEPQRTHIAALSFIYFFCVCVCACVCVTRINRNHLQLFDCGQLICC